MSTNILLPLAATTVLAVATTSVLMGVSSLPVAEASPRIVDLPAIIVRPAAEDAAYYQAHRIVDLDTVIVYPDASDLALSVATTSRRVDCLTC